MSDGTTIYDRVGGYDGFHQIATDILALHHANPILERRYGHSPKTDAELIPLVTELLCSVTGGSETYTGMSMLQAHTGMNVNAEEFVEVLDDILKALQKNGVSKADQDTILGLNYGLKNDVVGH
jgi:hemoglobin